MDIKEIRKLIREGMQELKEECGGSHSSPYGSRFGTPGTHPAHSEVDEHDPDMKAGHWNDLVDQCTLSPDPSFRLKIFHPAMAGASPQLWQSILELIGDEPELQDEILKVIDEFARNRR